MTKLRDAVRVNHGEQGDRGDLFKLKKRVADDIQRRPKLANDLATLHNNGEFKKERNSSE